jgi:hypothetical protein
VIAPAGIKRSERRADNGRMTEVVRKYVVNGETYDSLEAMPPDVRAQCESMMEKAKAGPTVVRTNEIKLSFQVTGPGLSFRRTFVTSGSPTPDGAVEPVPNPDPALPTTTPIEPASAEGGVRVAVVIGALGLLGLVLWLLGRAH